MRVTAPTAGEGGKWNIMCLTLQSEYDTIHSLRRESRPRAGRIETRRPARSRADPRLKGLGERRPRGAAHVRVSCVNQCLPQGQTDPEVVQGTAEFHDESTDSSLPQADPVLHETPARHTSACGDGRPPSDVGDSQRGDAIDQACCAAAPLPGGSLTIRLQAAGRTEDAGHGCGVSAAAGPQPWLSPSEGERLRARAHPGQACLITARHGRGTMGWHQPWHGPGTEA
jgi:hypothetical protein